jgi:hypothetical protein
VDWLIPTRNRVIAKIELWLYLTYLAKIGEKHLMDNEVAVEDFNKHIDFLPQRVRQVLVRRRA